MILLEIKKALEEILKENLVDWLSDDQKNLIVLEAEKSGINNQVDLAKFVMIDSKVFKSSTNNTIAGVDFSESLKQLKSL